MGRWEGGSKGRGYFLGEGNGNPLQYSCLENPMDGGAWWGTVHRVAKSQTRLSDFTFTFTFMADSCWGLTKSNKNSVKQLSFNKKLSKKKKESTQSWGKYHAKISEGTMTEASTRPGRVPISTSQCGKSHNSWDTGQSTQKGLTSLLREKLAQTKGSVVPPV